MSSNKTIATDASVAAHLDAIEDPARLDECTKLGLKRRPFFAKEKMGGGSNVTRSDSLAAISRSGLLVRPEVLFQPR